YPDKRQKNAKKLWEKQLLAMQEAIEKHMGRRITRRALSRARREVSQAKASLLSFWQLCWGSDELISPAARIFIRDSLFLARDLSEWSWHLDRLKEELAASKRRRAVAPYRPGILLLGSPVTYPSYKVPFLLEECGLSVLEVADEASLSLRCTKRKARRGMGKKEIIREMATALWSLDASPSYVENLSLLHHVKRLIHQGGLDGAVLHVLKGQIEQDFLLPKLEALLEEAHIPLFRLETDYNENDTEQLRIRMEAFSEMLSQNLYLEAARA
ncbi:MAG: 2-hydroxyacyl-CoA dehydratase, partial [Blautia sp.]|nr:2-hydroxyacyl-CoA dehydratase [Blautia sp.]